jgi:hypothetical protein
MGVASELRSVMVAVFLVVSSGMASAAERMIDSYTCKEVMSESDSSRQAATAFLHGYFLGKSGGGSIDLDAMAKQTDSFISQCLDNPNAKAAETMAAIKK